MEDEIKSYSENSPKKQRKTAFRFLIIEIVALALVILIVVFLSNYFNAIPLERFNSIFSSLPSQTETLPEETTNKELLNVGIESPDALPFAPCPLASIEICLQGEIIDNGEDFYGITYTDISVGMQVMAVMSGNYTVEEDEGRNIVTISDGHGGLRAVMNFIGEISIAQEGGNIEEGKPIGTIGTNLTSDDIMVVSFQSEVNDEFMRPEIGNNGDYIYDRL